MTSLTCEVMSFTMLLSRLFITLCVSCTCYFSLVILRCTSYTLSVKLVSSSLTLAIFVVLTYGLSDFKFTEWALSPINFPPPILLTSALPPPIYDPNAEGIISAGFSFIASPSKSFVIMGSFYASTKTRSDFLILQFFAGLVTTYLIILNFSFSWLWKDPFIASYESFSFSSFKSTFSVRKSPNGIIAWRLVK